MNCGFKTLQSEIENPKSEIHIFYKVLVQAIFEAINQLIAEPEKPKKRIGFVIE